MQSPESKPGFEICEDELERKLTTLGHANFRLLRGTEQETGLALPALERHPPSFGGTRSVAQASSANGGQFHAPVLEPFVEAEAAAEFLHYSARTVKQMARDGRVPAHPFGDGPRKRWFFLISELAQHLHARVNSTNGEAGRDKTQRRVV